MSSRKLIAWLKKRVKRIRLAYIRKFRSFDVTAVEEALRDVGIGVGDVLFVHSSYESFVGFTGKPSDVIAAMEKVVGPEGTLMMPSMPFNGSAIDYISAGNITDIRRTPSRMGMLTEVLRRQSGTRRSVHPTHPVLAKGRLASQMTAGHERARTPCGVGSPFSMLSEVNGKVLFLGTSIESMTFFHYLEEAYETKLPVSPFTSETVEARVKDGDQVESVTMRLFDQDQSRKRDISLMLPRLERRDAVGSHKVGGVGIDVIAAADAEIVFREMAEAGEALYSD